MERRTFIRATGTAATIGIAGLAGCAGQEDQPEEPAPEASPAEETDAGGPAEETTAQTETATETEQSPTGTGGGDQATNTIKMFTEGGQFYFDPVGLYLQPGDQVTWVIASGSHSTRSYQDRIPGDAQPWNSDILSGSGAKFTYTVEATGTYDYYCEPHQSLGMVGRLVVGEPGGPGADGDPPDGNVPSSETIVNQKVVPFGSEYAQQ